jgi:CDP-diacylglycerol--serine O-phosphatidyltransferase
MPVLSKISWADLFTLANGALGFVAITYIFSGNFIAATSLLLLSMIMDGLDGYMARRFGSKHSMGQVLDSISDSISFAFAPAILVYAELRDELNAAPSYSGWNLVLLACAVAILSCGLFRLARFSVSGYQLDHFVGLPAPAAALVLLLVCLLFGAPSGSESSTYYFAVAEVPWLIVATGFALSFLMASEIPYPKMRGWLAKASGIGILLAILPTAAGLVLVGDQSLYTASSRTATSIALVLALAYMLGGPLYERRKGDGR